MGITGHSGELIGVLSAKDVMFLVNQASIFQVGRGGRSLMWADLESNGLVVFN